MKETQPHGNPFAKKGGKEEEGRGKGKRKKTKRRSGGRK